MAMLRNTHYKPAPWFSKSGKASRPYYKLIMVNISALLFYYALLIQHPVPDR